MTNKADVFVITIDGESSTGKTVLSQYLAKELGYNFLNSGISCGVDMINICLIPASIKVLSG